jgi:hypothetical protein
MGMVYLQNILTIMQQHTDSLHHVCHYIQNNTNSHEQIFIKYTVILILNIAGHHNLENSAGIPSFVNT